MISSVLGAAPSGLNNATMRYVAPIIIFLYKEHVSRRALVSTLVAYLGIVLLIR